MHCEDSRKIRRRYNSDFVLALVFLAWLGYGESKTYYHTIAEYQGLQGSDRTHRMRMAGTVAPGSIQYLLRPRGIPSLEEQGKTLTISYVGTDPLPDTFKDKAQAPCRRSSRCQRAICSRARAGKMRFEV